MIGLNLYLLHRGECTVVMTEGRIYKVPNAMVELDAKLYLLMKP